MLFLQSKLCRICASISVSAQNERIPLFREVPLATSSISWYTWAPACTLMLFLFSHSFQLWSLRLSWLFFSAEDGPRQLSRDLPSGHVLSTMKGHLSQPSVRPFELNQTQTASDFPWAVLKMYPTYFSREAKGERGKVLQFIAQNWSSQTCTGALSSGCMAFPK